MKKAIIHLKNDQKNVGKLGINFDSLLELMQHHLKQIQQFQPYRSANIPIDDDKLVEICRKKCSQMDLSWGKESNMDDAFLIHKHMLRDR